MSSIQKQTARKPLQKKIESSDSEDEKPVAKNSIARKPVVKKPVAKKIESCDSEEHTDKIVTAIEGTADLEMQRFMLDALQRIAKALDAQNKHMACLCKKIARLE